MIRDFVRVTLGDDEHLQWSSGAVLERHYRAIEPFPWAGKRVLELGAGTGLLGCVLADRGALVTVTDMPCELARLQRQVDRHLAQHPRAHLVAVPLLWGERGWRESPLSQAPAFDVVMCADLIAIADAHADLLWTLCQLTCEPHVVVIFAFKDREDFSFSFMANVHDTGHFDVAEVTDIDMTNVETDRDDGTPDVLVYSLRRKASPPGE